MNVGLIRKGGPIIVPNEGIPRYSRGRETFYGEALFLLTKGGAIFVPYNLIGILSFPPCTDESGPAAMQHGNSASRRTGVPAAFLSSAVAVLISARGG